MLRLVFLAGASLVWCAVVGCGGPAPRIEAPRIDVAAERLFKEYDRDADGSLSAKELKAFPAVGEAAAFYDADQDGAVSAVEFQARLKQIVGTKVGLMPFFCHVQRNGEPLADAKVELTPEPALAAVLKPAHGVTDAKGKAQLAVPDDLLPESDRGLNMMHPGLYRVRITHATVAIPEQYNTATTLGQEVNGDSLVGKNIVFAVTSP